MAKKPSNRKPTGNRKTSKGRGKSKSVKGKSKGRKSKSKQSSKPKVNKGLNLYIHVRSVLWREFKANYNPADYSTSGSEFLVTAGKVYRECRSRASECTDDVIIQKYNSIVGGEKRLEPFIGRDLYGQARPYWEIEQINWNQFEPYLWIVSTDIIPSPHEFQVSEFLGVDGNTHGGFNKYFKQWVDYNNESDNVNIREEGSEGELPYFVFSKPRWNEIKKRWESTIHIVTASSERRKGEEEWEGWSTATFGFTPKGQVTEPKIPKTLEYPTKKKKEKVKPTETETDKKLKQAQIKKVEEESKLVKEKRQVVQIDKLNKKNEGLMKQLEMYARLGNKEKVKSLEARIEVTNLMIDKLSK